MNEENNRYEIQDKINILRLHLQALNDAQVKSYPDEVGKLLQKNLGRLLFGALPKNVTELDLSNGLKVTRSDKDINTIQPNQRQTWDLPKIDSYGATLAKGIKQDWTVIFPKP